MVCSNTTFCRSASHCRLPTDHGSSSRHADPRKRHAAVGVLSRRRMRRGWPGLFGRPGRRWQRSSSTPIVHPRRRDSKMITAARARAPLRGDHAQGAGLSVASAPPGNRRNQYPPCVAAGDAARVLALAPLPDLVLVDAFRIPDLPVAQRAVLHGDRRCSAIAAASIVAKVTRDREMLAHHASDPRYGYDRHKGYCTADHLAAVARHGYSPLHRRTFRPPSLFDTIE